MITANGEVQTSEEAQVDVYDHDLCVTVHMLDGTPAVLSLGNSAKSTVIRMGQW